jgi:predicted metal-dependent peptidase
MTHEQTLDRIVKTRMRLTLERRFYGALVAAVEPVISTKVPTAATNSKVHYWNPDFVQTLDAEELLAVQVHESEHDARHHSTRRNGRDPVEWNISCDYSINIDLRDEGFKLPKGALVDAKYRGMSAEDIFRSRELDREREQEKKREEPETKEQDEQDNLDEADTDAGNGAQDQNEDEDVDGDTDDQPGDQGDVGDTSDEPGEDAGDDAGQGNPAGEDADEGNGQGDGEDAGEDDGEPHGSSGDVGGMGEVLDAPGDAAELAEQDIEWESKVQTAVNLAKKIGTVPGYITREIERAKNPPRDWRDELREFAEQGALKIETWNRPNRRFAGRGLTLPSTQRDGVNKAVFLIDTSGSMDAVALAAVRDEAQTLLDDGIINEAVVVYGDTRVTRVDTYTTSDEIEFDPRGGGGTDMKPLFKFVADEHEDASLIINFTDLYIGDPGPEPHCPVLFAVTGYPTEVKRLIENAPWGAKGLDVGVH